MNDDREPAVQLDLFKPHQINVNGMKLHFARMEDITLWGIATLLKNGKYAVCANVGNDYAAVIEVSITLHADTTWKDGVRE